MPQNLKVYRTFGREICRLNYTNIWYEFIQVYHFIVNINHFKTILITKIKLNISYNKLLKAPVFLQTWMFQQNHVKANIQSIQEYLNIWVFLFQYRRNVYVNLNYWISLHTINALLPFLKTDAITAGWQVVFVAVFLG